MENHTTGETHTDGLRPIERRQLEHHPDQAPQVTWREQLKPHRGEELLKNLGVAAALVICAVTLHSGSTPGDLTDAVLTAVSGDTLLDDSLGKLTFVSTLFPEATLVFGETERLACPVLSEAVAHAWTEAEPYLSFSGTGEVYAACGGEVMGVYHGVGEERLVRVLRADGLECCYGNLRESAVAAGDTVLTGSLLGVSLPGEDVTLEVRRNGYSIDPTGLLEGEP